ncbi:MAG: aldehyde ferredoxin oxidoreductase, partial [Clostridia bacterium]|nr:aldehyde ferredoxin oxidoreductase [Clostridia bacterium]
MKGYTGNILHVNLTTGKFEIEHPDESFYRTYIGGSCMGAYYVMKGMKKGLDALAPESVLVFSLGPICGSTISGAARHSITAKSPQTGGIMASEAGGYWAPELKWAGFDALVITGKFDKPVYLWIHNGEFQLRDASNIWGKTTKDAQEIIRTELGDKRIRVAQIGVAG